MSGNETAAPSRRSLTSQALLGNPEADTPPPLAPPPKPPNRRPGQISRLFEMLIIRTKAGVCACAFVCVCVCVRVHVCVRACALLADWQTRVSLHARVCVCVR